MLSQLEQIDKQILNVIQTAFPLVEEPYRAIGDQVGVSQEEVIRRIELMKRRNIVRQISAIFDSRRLGYRSTLVAMRFPSERLDRAARHISRHPGVSHNYSRDYHFNLWFTLTLPPGSDLEETVERMAEETGAEAARMMPAIRLFKIGVNFDVVGSKAAAYPYLNPDRDRGGNLKDWNRVEVLTDFEIQVIRGLQEDLALIPYPFNNMACRLGIYTHRLIEYACDFQRRGVMRRFSAVLHHRGAGFKANAMVVWKAPLEQAEEVGRVMAAHPAVTHCYQRPTFPDWPYTHFTMIHATTKKGCDEAAREISSRTGIRRYQLLYSTRQYKKTRVRYFV